MGKAQKKSHPVYNKLHSQLKWSSITSSVHNISAN